jgi:hypothetical protein
LDAKEIPLPFSLLAKELEKLGYCEKSHYRLRVYAKRGVRVTPAAQPIVLESWKINGFMTSTVAAYERFIRQQMAAQEAEQRSDAPA